VLNLSHREPGLRKGHPVPKRRALIQGWGRSSRAALDHFTTLTNPTTPQGLIGSAATTALPVLRAPVTRDRLDLTPIPNNSVSGHHSPRTAPTEEPWIPHAEEHFLNPLTVLAKI